MTIQKVILRRSGNLNLKQTRASHPSEAAPRSPKSCNSSENRSIAALHVVAILTSMVKVHVVMLAKGTIIHV